MAHSKKFSDTMQSENDKRISEIEQEYIFKTIPKGRPSSQPVPPTRNSLTISSDTGTVTLQLHDSKSVTNHALVGLGDSSHRNKSVSSNSNPVPRLELYKEALYTCVHMLGKPSPDRFPSTQQDMCLYAHATFSENQKQQDVIMDHVRNEPFPLTIVNAKVRRGVGLKGSKNSGMVDPYCVITIETEDSSVVFQLGKREWQHFTTETPLKRVSKDLTELRAKQKHPLPEERESQVYEDVPDFIKTSVIRRNKDPKWDQRFQCLSLRPSVDKLTVEVWDHSIDDKYVAKTIRRSSDPPTAAAVDEPLRTMHERKGDVYLGKVTVKISEIPCDGVDSWYPLTGAPQTKEPHAHGKLRLQIWLVHAYRHGRNFTEVAEPRVILGYLWDWVLQEEKASQSDPAKWDGSIPSAATCLLFQYALQNGISEDAHAIIRWNAYAKHDLNLSNVESRLHELSEVIEKEEVKSRDSKDGKPSERLRKSQPDIEENILDIVRNRIVPIIRNHLKEPSEVVHDALRSYQECVQILSKLNNPYLLEQIAWLVDSALRMCILEWYREMHARTVQIEIKCKLVQQIEYVTSMVQVLKEVNALLKHGEMKWSPEFWLIASMQYLPVVYDELQKMVIHDVEAVCRIFFDPPLDYKKLRKILLGNDEKDKNLCSALFDLYVQTQIFIFARNDIFDNAAFFWSAAEGGEKSYCELSDYDRWFRPTLILWLGFAIVRGSMMINKTINIDNNVQDNAIAMTSSSALDTANVFWQLVKFWKVLKWPDIAEGYVIINFLMDVMCSYTILYAELKHAKLEKEGYYDPHGRFDISERLCTALNNIEHVKEQAINIPKEVNYEQLLERLEEVCGKSAEVVDYEVKAKERLDKTILIVDKHMDDILENVGIRLQRDISAFVDDSLNMLMEVNSERLEDALDPLIVYLEDNIVTLQNALLPFNFHRVLLLLWNLVCRGYKLTAIDFKMSNAESQNKFFMRIIQVIPFLQTYFEGGDAGLTRVEMNTKDYEEMKNLFLHYTMDTNELIGIYYSTTALYHMSYKGPANFGTLRVRIGYWNQKLSVEVMSASDLTPHDEPLTFLKCFQTHHPTSDPMVELELKPNSTFPNEKKWTTDIKWNNLNPVFEQTFSWPITGDDCIQPSAVLVLTVKDYDLLSKNAFLGEAIVPLHLIPGISSSPVPQPMNLTLQEVDYRDDILIVLKSRNWDSAAQQFSNDQLSRFVEPVISRKHDEDR